MTITGGRALDWRRVRIEVGQLCGARAEQQDDYTWTRASGPHGGFLVVAVADGMGSGAGSAVIAQDAVRAATRIAAAYGPDRLDAAIDATREIVNERHYERDEHDDTTLTLVSIDQQGVVRVAWMGDSRAYVLTGDGHGLTRLTNDHNLGEYGRPNVLTRSLLGPNGHDHVVDDCTEHTAEVAVHEGPALAVLLCTDGVHGPLSDRQIRSLLLDADDASEAARYLVEDAVDAADDEADNATALVIDLGGLIDGDTR